jgi:tRNA(fMet)-specific endonuclease VapC
MSLFILDTDIVSLFRDGQPQVTQRVAAHPPADLAVTVLSIEEQLSGWYTMLRRAKRPPELERAYRELAEAVRFYASWPVLLYNHAAIARLAYLRTLKLRVGTTDLRIAAIALENAAAVVTRNLRDFRRVPGLTAEDWSV